MPESRFLGGSETNLSGCEFEPNIPSEEAFTTPKKGRGEGRVDVAPGLPHPVQHKEP